MKSKPTRHFALVVSSALVLVLAPMSPLDNLFGVGTEAFAKSKGNNGNGNASNKGGGNSENKSSKSGNTKASGNSARANKSTNQGSANSSPNKKNKHKSASSSPHNQSSLDQSTEGETVAPVPQLSPKRNLRAQLGGLNSLNRNINGLMNSSDPRMDGVRDFILASVENERAKEQVELAQIALGDVETALGDHLAQLLSDNGFEGDTLSQLQSRLTELESAPLLETDEGFEEWQQERDLLTATLEVIRTDETLQGLLTDFSDSEALLAELEATAAELGESVSEEQLIAALMLAANKNRIEQSGEDYVTPEILEWAQKVLGVGEYQGLIDDYAARTGNEALLTLGSVVIEDIDAPTVELADSSI